MTKEGSVRDRAIIVLMLHTGLRAREVCTLTRAQVRLGKRSGVIIVHGKPGQAGGLGVGAGVSGHAVPLPSRPPRGA